MALQDKMFQENEVVDALLSVVAAAKLITAVTSNDKQYQSANETDASLCDICGDNLEQQEIITVPICVHKICEYCFDKITECPLCNQELNSQAEIIDVVPEEVKSEHIECCSYSIFRMIQICWILYN